MPCVLICLLPSAIFFLPDNNLPVVGTGSQDVSIHRVSPGDLPHGTFVPAGNSAIRKSWEKPVPAAAVSHRYCQPVLCMRLMQRCEERGDTKVKNSTQNHCHWKQCQILNLILPIKILSLLLENYRSQVFKEWRSPCVISNGLSVPPPSSQNCSATTSRSTDCLGGIYHTSYIIKGLNDKIVKISTDQNLPFTTLYPLRSAMRICPPFRTSKIFTDLSEEQVASRVP